MTVTAQGVKRSGKNRGLGAVARVIATRREEQIRAGIWSWRSLQFAPGDQNSSRITREAATSSIAPMVETVIDPIV
jgi:hypothetical protein